MDIKINLTAQSPTINAADLGQMLGLTEREVKSLMRAGEITSRYEVGVDADAGMHRLTFWYGDTTLRLTCGADGGVLKSSRVKAPPKV